MMITASDFSGGIKAIPSDTINIPGPESKYDGISTAVAASKLTDTLIGLQGGFIQILGANGKVINQGVQIGDVVYNTSTARPGVAYVTAIDSATSLSLSANIFLQTADRDSYRIYRGHGVDLSTAWGWKLVVEDLLPEVTFNDAAGFTAGTDQAIVPSGGTYLGDATFSMTVDGTGEVTGLDIVTTGSFSEVDLTGQTLIFDAASIEGVFGGGGTGQVNATFVASNITFSPEKLDVGNAIPFQLYCGGTTAVPPLACDIYVTTIDGDFVFFEGVQPGEILPVAICRVNAGAAAAGGNGNTNTLTTATGRYVALN